MALTSKLQNRIEEREDRKRKFTPLNRKDHRSDLEIAKDKGIAPWDQPDDTLTDFHVAVFFDKYPVTKGHRLFVPVYNNDAIIKECFEYALRIGRKMVESRECQGFNVGLNIGKTAGQTVMYPHVHLIPRCEGDCDDPTGGVRGVIQGQANYKSDSYQLPTYVSST